MEGVIVKYAAENIIVNCSALLFLIFLKMQNGSIKNSLLLDQKLFTTMVDLAMVQCFVEAFSFLADKEQFFMAREICYVINIMYFLINIAFSLLWAFYAIYRVYGSVWKVKRYVPIIIWPALICVILVLTTPLTGAMFTISTENVYHRGYLFILPFLVTVAYLLFGAIFIEQNRRRINKYMIMPLFFILTPIFIGMFVQTAFPGMAMIAMVITIALVGAYVSVQSESAYIDRLSGVYNRRYLDDYLISLSESPKNIKEKKTVTGIMLDMDKFKSINDNFGHHMGDEAISQVGEILRKNLNKRDFAARYGGDEFIIISTLLDSDSIENLMKKLNSAADEKNKSGNYPYHLEFSYGYAQFTATGDTNCDEFMKQIDDNMYEYKVAKKKRQAEAAETAEKVKV